MDQSQLLNKFMDFKWCIIILLTLRFGAKAQTNIHEVFKSAELISKSKDVYDSLGIAYPDTCKIRPFANFDYCNLNPVTVEIDSSDFYTIGYDSLGKIATLDHFEFESRLVNFHLDFFHFPDYVIFALKDWDSDYYRKNTRGYDYLPGFFVYIKSNSNIYFVNTFRRGSYYFSPIFPTFGIKGISSISKINSDFYLTHTFRFTRTSLDYFSEIRFESDEKSIKYEELYFYDKKMPTSFMITDSTNFEDLDSLLFEYKAAKTLTGLPCIHPSERHMPLWIFAGSHEICWD